MLHGYLAGGVETDWSLEDNRRAFAEWGFIPRCLVDARARHTRTTLFGTEYAAPFGIPPMDPEHDRAMVCGSLAFNVDVKAILESFGLHEGANSDPKQFVVEKAFVGDGI